MGIKEQVNSVLVNILGADGVLTNPDERHANVVLCIRTIEDMERERLLTVREFADPNEFAGAIQSIMDGSSDPSGRGSLCEEWHAFEVGGVRAVDTYSASCNEFYIGESGSVPSFDLGASGAVVFEVVKSGLSGFVRCVCRSWKAYIYQPTADFVDTGGDYRSIRDLCDIKAFGGNAAHEICAALTEDELSMLACAIRSGRATLQDVRGSGFEEVRRALTATTRIEISWRGGEYSDGFRLLKSWASSGLSVGERYICDGHVPDREYAERRKIEPQFTWGKYGWALMRTAWWRSWPIDNALEIGETSRRRRGQPYPNAFFAGARMKYKITYHLVLV